LAAWKLIILLVEMLNFLIKKKLKILKIL